MLMLSETKHHKPTHWSLLRQRASSPSGPAPYSDVEHRSLVLVSLVHLSRERSAKTIVTVLQRFLSLLALSPPAVPLPAGPQSSSGSSPCWPSVLQRFLSLLALSPPAVPLPAGPQSSSGSSPCWPSVLQRFLSLLALSPPAVPLPAGPQSSRLCLCR
ncbi:unnamed protein product [Boreogadus saida]